MDELLSKIKDLDIPEDKAQQVVDTVVEFLKEKLPGPLGEKVEDLLEGKEDQIADLAQKLPGTLGGLLGK